MSAMTFIETSIYTRAIAKLLDDEGQREVQNEIAQDPGKGALIPGGGGLRKLRFADARRGKGKRGGLRIIYYWNAEGTVLLLLAYGKDQADDFSPDMKRILRNVIKEAGL